MSNSVSILSNYFAARIPAAMFSAVFKNRADRKTVRPALSTLRGESLTALKSSACKHVSAVFGLHTGTESMHLFALPFFRLVGLPHCVMHLFPIAKYRDREDQEVIPHRSCFTCETKKSFAKRSKKIIREKKRFCQAFEGRKSCIKSIYMAFQALSPRCGIKSSFSLQFKKYRTCKNFFSLLF